LIIGLLFYGRKKIASLFKNLGKKGDKPSNEIPPADASEKEEEIEEAVLMDE
jgi:hypothetical protein